MIIYSLHYFLPCCYELKSCWMNGPWGRGLTRKMRFTLDMYENYSSDRDEKRCPELAVNSRWSPSKAPTKLATSMSFFSLSLLQQKSELSNLWISSRTSVSISREWTGFGLKECVPRDRKKEKLRERGLVPRCEEVLEWHRHTFTCTRHTWDQNLWLPLSLNRRQGYIIKNALA